MDTEPGADSGWDPVARINLLPLSYLLFCFIPQNLLKYSAKNIATVAKQFTERCKNLTHEYETYEYILSGSRAEGFGISYHIFEGTHLESDIDIMRCGVRKFKVDESDSDTHPGYAKLIDTEGRMNVTGAKHRQSYVSNHDVFQSHDELKLNTTNIRNDGASKHVVAVIGPSLRESVFFFDSEIKFHECDTVFCLRYPHWPNQADEWLHRKRECDWPSQTIIHRIKAGGCHFVPVAHAHSASPDYEWRYSFSKAEIILANSLTDFQKYCFILFKILVMSTIIKDIGVVKTYHLKTIMFHCCEKIPAEKWKPVNLAFCLFYLLDNLIESLKRRKLNHFFITNNNLFSHVDKSDITNVERIILSLRHNPVEYIVKCHEKVRYRYRKYNNFGNVFKTIVDLCSTRDVADMQGRLQQGISDSSPIYSRSLMSAGLHTPALESLHNGSRFFGYEESERHIQETYLCLLQEHLGLGTFDMYSQLNALGFLYQKQYWIDFSKNEKISQAIYATGIDFFEKMPDQPDVQRDIHKRMLYSVLHFMNRQHSQAYAIAKNILDDKAIDPDESMRMGTSIALDPDIFEETEALGCDHAARILLYALFVAIKSINRTELVNQIDYFVDYAERINQRRYIRLLNPLLIALVYMEANHFINATEYFCLQHVRDEATANRVQNILVSILLEFLQLSLLSHEMDSSRFRRLVRLVLDCTRKRPLGDIPTIEAIDEIMSDLITLYETSPFEEFSHRRRRAALHAALTIKTFSGFSIEKLKVKKDYWEQYVMGIDIWFKSGVKKRSTERYEWVFWKTDQSHYT